MQIYIIRHAHAHAGDNDDLRPLSRKGRGQIREVGDFLRRHGPLGAREFWHSPLVRARDTARLLAKRLRSRIKLREVEGLRHEDEPAIVAKRLNAAKRPVAVVGHEPHLGALATLLLTGKPTPSRFVLKKGAVLALERTPKGWAVRWQISPDIF